MSELPPTIDTTIEKAQTREELLANVALAKDALSTCLEVIGRQMADGVSNHKVQRELDPIMLNEEEIRSVGKSDVDFSTFCFELGMLYKHPEMYIERGKSLDVTGQYLPNLKPYVEGFLESVEIFTSEEGKSMSPEAKQQLHAHMKSTLDTIYKLTNYHAADSDSFPSYQGQFSATDCSSHKKYTFDSARKLKLVAYDGDVHNDTVVSDQELRESEKRDLIEKKSYIRSEFDRRIENILLRCRTLGLDLKKSVKHADLQLSDVPQELRDTYISKVQAVVDQIDEIIKQSPENYFGTDFPEFLEITEIEKARQNLRGFVSGYVQYKN